MAFRISKDIYLTQLKVSDASALYQAVELSRDNLSKYLPWVKNVVDHASAESYIDSRLNNESEGAEWFVITFKNKFGGVFGIKSINPDLCACELGYWLSNYALGNQVVGKILDVVIPYLANKKRVRVVEFHCLESNVASVKIVERTGATLTRKIENTFEVPDKEQLMCIYALEI